MLQWTCKDMLVAHSPRFACRARTQQLPRYLLFACHNHNREGFYLTLSAHSASPDGQTALIVMRRRVDADSPALLVTLNVML
jgi:hypothetical protein